MQWCFSQSLRNLELWNLEILGLEECQQGGDRKTEKSRGRKKRKVYFKMFYLKKWKHIYKNVKFTWCFLCHWQRKLSSLEPVMGPLAQMLPSSSTTPRLILRDWCVHSYQHAVELTQVSQWLFLAIKNDNFFKKNLCIDSYTSNEEESILFLNVI